MSTDNVSFYQHGSNITELLTNLPQIPGIVPAAFCFMRPSISWPLVRKITTKVFGFLLDTSIVYLLFWDCASNTWDLDDLTCWDNDSHFSFTVIKFFLQLSSSLSIFATEFSHDSSSLNRVKPKQTNKIHVPRTYNV